MWNINTNSNYSNFYIGKDESDNQQEALFRSNIEKQINKAVEDKEFEIYLQPKVNLRENRVCGAEALIRWRHPKQGLLLPGKFIPKLEALKLTHLIDYFAFRRVCEYQKERIKQNHLTYFNVSPRLYKSTDVINPVDYEYSAYVRFLEENFHAHHEL